VGNPGLELVRYGRHWAYYAEDCVFTALGFRGSEEGTVWLVVGFRVWLGLIIWFRVLNEGGLAG
jgi:hypothetical protein